MAIQTSIDNIYKYIIGSTFIYIHQIRMSMVIQLFLIIYLIEKIPLVKYHMTVNYNTQYTQYTGSIDIRSTDIHSPFRY